jgi:hypothetical protein
MRWFESHVRCPVCRYDIREFNRYNEESEYNDNITDGSSNIINESTTNLSNILRNLISTELNRTVPIVNNSMNDLFYSLNIPFEMDISYSNLS